MSNSENSREDIERSSEEILEETMREIRDDLQSSSQDDVSNASSEEDDGVIRLETMKNSMTGQRTKRMHICPRRWDRRG